MSEDPDSKHDEGSPPCLGQVTSLSTAVGPRLDASDISSTLGIVDSNVDSMAPTGESAVPKNIKVI